DWPRLARRCPCRPRSGHRSSRSARPTLPSACALRDLADGEARGARDREEARERGRDRGRVPDLDRLVTEEARDRERHRDTVVAVAVDRAAMEAPPALDDQARLALLDLRAERSEPARHDGEPVAFLVPQLLGAADDG